MEGTFEAGVRMWQEDWFQGWACDVLEAAIRVFRFLAFYMTAGNYCPLWKPREALILISRFFIPRHPATWSLLAPFFLHAYWIAHWEKRNFSAGPSIVQKCSRHYLGKVRLHVISHLNISEPPLELTLLSLSPPASEGQGYPWSLRVTGTTGEAGLIPMSFYSLWALLLPRSPF